MSNYLRLVISYPETVNEFKSFCPLDRGDARTNVQELLNYLTCVAGGSRSASIAANTGPTAGTATLTVSAGGSSAAETMVLCGFTFTARASGATGNEFNVSATAATQAANMVAAFNASADITGKVVASNALGVITLTALVPGTAGNAFVVTESLTNVAVTTSFLVSAAGTEGTAYTLDMS